MKIVDLKHPDRAFPSGPCGLVLGNFDGVHRGHLALIEALKQQSALRQERLPLGAFCFEEHPFHHFGRSISLLSSNEEKMELFRQAGLQFVIFEDFSTLKDLSPEEYATDFLVKKCDCRIAVCGFNHSFGKKGAGKPLDLVRYLGAYEDRTAVIIPPVLDGNISVSSSVIRDMLERGHPEDAARLLGRPYALAGVAYTTSIKKNSTAFGLSLPADRVIPTDGRYAVYLRLEKRELSATLEITKQPAANATQLLCELQSPIFDSPLDGEKIEILFLEHLS